MIWYCIGLISSLQKLEVWQTLLINWEMYHKIDYCRPTQGFKIFFTQTSWGKWSWRCQQWSSRWSRETRWCWIQDRDQRALQGRQWSPQDPFWCFSQTLEQIIDWKSHKEMFTHNSVLAKEDVDNSNVLLPSVVEVVLKNQTFCSSRFYRWLSDKQLVLVPSPHGVDQACNVGRNRAVIGFFVSFFHLE